MTSFHKTICLIDDIKLADCLNEMLSNMGIVHTIQPDDIQLARNEYELDFLTDTLEVRMIHVDFYTGQFDTILKTISDNPVFDIFNSISISYEVVTGLIYIMLTNKQMEFEFETHPAFE